MKLRYRLTRLDVIRGSIRAVVLTRAAKIYFGALTSFVVGLSLFATARDGKSVGFMISYALFQFVLLALFVVFVLTVTTSLSLLFGKGKGVVGEHELEVSESGLHERTEFNDSLHRWKGVTDLIETANFFYVRVNESGGSMHLIPKNGGIIEGDVGLFVGALKKMMLAT